MGFCQAKVYQCMRQAAFAVIRLDKDVQQVAALHSSGVEGVRRPVQHQDAGGGYGAAILFGDPARVFACADHALHPGLKVAAHGVEDRLLGPSHGGEHCAPVGGDKRGIGWGSRTCLHSLEYRGVLLKLSFAGRDLGLDALSFWDAHIGLPSFAD